MLFYSVLVTKKEFCRAEHNKLKQVSYQFFQKAYLQSKTEKVNIIIEFRIF